DAVRHYCLVAGCFAMQRLGSQSAVWLITLLMAPVGGRVLPMFTANGTMPAKAQPIVWLDRIALGSLWLIFILNVTLLSSQLPPGATGVLYAIAAFALGWRCLRRRLWVTWRVTLLWSRHSAYWTVPLGLMVL